MGKMAFFLVLGFSTIFLIMGHNANSVSSRSVENMVDYHAKTVAHNIAVSGANLAANEIFMDNTWKNGFSSVQYEDGYLDASVTVLDAFLNIRKLTTTGTFRGVSKSVEVIFQPSKFSKFAYLSISDPTNLYWSYKDTIWGPFHSQGNIKAYRHPVFHGKATTNGTVQYYQSEALDAPHFYGGFESGVSITFPPSGLTDLQTLAGSGGHVFTGKDSVYLTFAGDSLKFRFKYSDPDSTVLTSSFAPNGVIFAENSIIKMKGIVKGQYTVGVSGTAPKGNVYLQDDIVYNTDPRTNPNSTDILGIVSKNNVLIENNLANQTDINIHASIYCEKGGFGAGWTAFLKPNGNINLLGGIQNYSRVQIGIINNGNIWGFNRRYKYDDRLMLASPPGYPGTGTLEIVSWFE